MYRRKLDSDLMRDPRRIYWLDPLIVPAEEDDGTPVSLQALGWQSTVKGNTVLLYGPEGQLSRRGIVVRGPYGGVRWDDLCAEIRRWSTEEWLQDRVGVAWLATEQGQAWAESIRPLGTAVLKAWLGAAWPLSQT